MLLYVPRQMEARTMVSMACMARMARLHCHLPRRASTGPWRLQTLQGSSLVLLGCFCVSALRRLSVRSGRIPKAHNARGVSEWWEVRGLRAKGEMGRNGETSLVCFVPSTLQLLSWSASAGRRRVYRWSAFPPEARSKCLSQQRSSPQPASPFEFSCHFGRFAVQLFLNNSVLFSIALSTVTVPSG